jgi:AbrB family looped-hinge helix DNA binding protein
VCYAQKVRKLERSPSVAKATVRRKGQVTIPASIRRAARLEEGDLVELEVVAEGILLRPRKLIDATQAWFWMPDWQAREREADEDIRAGRSEKFGSDEEFLAALEARVKPRNADS